MVPVQCTDPQCVATMRAILTETLDVLENDLFFAALVPMHRELFIQDVIHSAKGSVRSYDFHFPSSYQHYRQMKLVDTRALNGFVVRKGRELSKPAPINECVPFTPQQWSTAPQGLFGLKYESLPQRIRNSSM